MQPVAAGAAVAVPAGSVAGQVHENIPAGRCRAAADPVALAGYYELGEAHREMGGHPVGQRRLRAGHVNVRAAAVVRDDLRDRPGLREQRIQHPDGGGVVAFLAGGGDGVQLGEMRAQPRQVARTGADPVERVAITERLHVGHIAQAVTGSRAAGVDQLGAAGQSLQQVSSKTALTPVGRRS